METYTQLTLNFQLRNDARFESFFAETNKPLLQDLKDATQSCVFFYGESGCGKTHLLHALCHEYSRSPQNTSYIPLLQYEQFSPLIFDGLEDMALVCIDDVHIIAGLEEWETALFHLYNKLRDSQSRIVVSSVLPVQSLNLNLADLQSRLVWGPVYQLKTLSDETKVIALQHRANLRGFEMPKEVCNYLLTHYSRDVSRLFELLDKLDTATLVAQRKLTIPFVRKYFTEGN